MQSFLEETILKILRDHDDISRLTIILPSKRAGGFFKKYLQKHVKKTSFLPKILSIEDFVAHIADLEVSDSTSLLLSSYNAYLKTTSFKEKEPFESYTSWAQILLNDLNEIDRYLVDTNSFFDYLKNIKVLESWKVNDQSTEMVNSYLSFWSALPEYYSELKELLIAENKGYQGMIYRKAAEEIEHYLVGHGDEPHIFIGFNALNQAEQSIIKELLEYGNCEIYWDADRYFFDTNHSAAFFMQRYFSEWKYYNNKAPELSSNFEKPKQFEFIEAQKRIGQAKYVGQILETLSSDELNKTAVVLADESLLVPVLHSLPNNVKTVNVTMGVPIKNFPTALFFVNLLRIHSKQPKSFYYKDVLSVLNSAVVAALLDNAEEIVLQIATENRTYITLKELNSIADETNQEMLEILFGNWGEDGAKAIAEIRRLLLQLKPFVADNSLEKVLVFQLYKILGDVELQQQQFSHLKNIGSIYTLFKDAITTSRLDYQGDAYQGLQIMGVLETRGLDFKNIIMTSVNEGILPSGKSSSSFLTYDLKTTYGLPLYTDKDAIYTYHFYRLLHRAENIKLIYSSFTDGLKVGEKSRFMLQLEIANHNTHQINKKVIAPVIKQKKAELQQIAKTEVVIERLKELAAKGFSPSALTAYVRNPLDFYIQKILKIDEDEFVEETADFKTLGSVVHNALEFLYKPYEGKQLDKTSLLQMKLKISETVSNEFSSIYKKGIIDHGKNLLIFEVAKRYVQNAIDADLALIKAGNSLHIHYIERKFRMQLDFPEFEFPVYLHGLVDRVDILNGAYRIIDYKTGKVTQPELRITDWENITEDYKYSKAFQVLCYALMISEEEAIPNELFAGILSFKNFNQGFLKFGIKDELNSRKYHESISKEVISRFSEELKRLILQICNPEISFTEKEV